MSRPELDIRSEVPLLPRIVSVIDFFIVLLFVNPVAAFVWDVATITIFAVVVTSKIRELSNRTVLNVAIIVGFVFISFVWGALISLVLERLTVGRPVFGILGGLPKRIFFTSMKLATAIKYHLKPSDEARLNAFRDLDLEYIEAALKSSYRDKIHNRMTEPRPDFESAWKQEWNNILDVGVEDTTLRETLEKNHFAFTTIPNHLDSTSSLMAPFIKLFQVVLICLLARYLNGASQLVTVVQICIGLGFVFTILWFMNHVRSLGEIGFLGVIGMTEELKGQFGDRFEALKGSKVRPKKIEIKKRYFALIRDFLARIGLIPILFVNTALVLMLVTVAILIARIGLAAHFQEMLRWYKGFAIGLVALACGFVATYYLSFMIIQNIRRILAPVVASLVGALLPFVVTFVITGKFEIQQITSQLSAILAGAGILVTATLSSLLQKKVAGEE